MKQILKKIFTVLVIGLLLFGLDWFPFKIVTNVNKEMSVILWNKDGTEYASKTINIEGKLISRLWRNKEFKGSFEVEGYDFSKKDSSYEPHFLLRFSPKTGLYYGSMDYYSVEEREYLGKLFTNETFSKLFIVQPNTSPLNMYVAPANNFEEADTLVRKYMPKAFRGLNFSD